MASLATQPTSNSTSENGTAENHSSSSGEEEEQMSNPIAVKDQYTAALDAESSSGEEEEPIGQVKDQYDQYTAALEQIRVERDALEQHRHELNEREKKIILLRFNNRIATQRWSNKEFVLEAVAEKGCALEHASDELRNDREVVMAAVAQDSDALEYASAALQEELKSYNQ